MYKTCGSTQKHNIWRKDEPVTFLIVIHEKALKAIFPSLITHCLHLRIDTGIRNAEI